MSAKKLLVVVDDNRRFAVHVWRQLTGAMEFGFAGSHNAPFRRTSADDALEVEWYNPREGNPDDYAQLLRASQSDLWTIIDVRGVPSRSGQTGKGWLEYQKTFIDLHDAKEKAREKVWIMSAYGSQEWDEHTHVRPKTIESLRALQQAMDLCRELRTPSEPPDARSHVNILVTGAGFELVEQTLAGVSIGCPDTSRLLWWMKSPVPPMEKEPAAEEKRPPYPVHFDDDAIKEPARKRYLDDYWDALLGHLHLPKVRSPEGARREELSWREAFRRVFLAYDVGHQIQSLAAAQLPWDYWLTTNYTRFADRAIDMAGDGVLSRPWRAINTSIEADAVAPFAGSDADLALAERIIVKLHGDIGHVWTMAIAGQDKQVDSKLFVRPELHRMYAVAEVMLLGTLWRRQAIDCTWHVVGHGLGDHALQRLIGTVIQRSPPRAQHHLILVGPVTTGTVGEATDGATLELSRRFDQAGQAEVAERLLTGDRISARREPFSALEYMTRLAARGLIASRIEPRTSEVVALGAATVAK
jgi:hypothetical protein